MRPFPLLTLIALQPLLSLSEHVQLSFPIGLPKFNFTPAKWWKKHSACSGRSVHVGNDTVQLHIAYSTISDKKCEMFFWDLCLKIQTCNFYASKESIYEFTCGYYNKRPLGRPPRRFQKGDCQKSRNCTLSSVDAFIGKARPSVRMELNCPQHDQKSEPPKSKGPVQKPNSRQSPSPQKFTHTTLQINQKPSETSPFMAHKEPASSAHLTDAESNLHDDDFLKETHATSAPPLPSAMCNNRDVYCFSMLAIAIILGPCVVLVLVFGIGTGILIARSWSDKPKTFEAAQPVPRHEHSEMRDATDITEPETETASSTSGGSFEDSTEDGKRGDKGFVITQNGNNDSRKGKQTSQWSRNVPVPAITRTP
ncbi:hypothetical protein Tcan_08362 [Toxocara canis]|uniref:ZP domain-containing protein n=1 Tax=Toxocara canis TaxID=6265 RepID=A0A0B2W0K6_TOXCA|nr:hypothetical protein Tcan_08362 [Toxocara canis]